MNMIDQIKADREKRILGGPWRVLKGKYSLQVHSDRHWIANIKCESCPAYEESTARRIARVPDMEAALIAAEELANAYALYESRANADDPAGWAAMDNALAAFRAATGTS